MNIKFLVLIAVLVFLLPAIGICSDSVVDADTHEFPPSLASYDDAHLESIPMMLRR